jgi:hypothetical protein
MHIGNLQINLPKVRTSGVGAGCLVALAAIVAWLLAVCASILLSAIAVDALYHLGHWLLGW